MMGVPDEPGPASAGLVDHRLPGGNGVPGVAGLFLREQVEDQTEVDLAISTVGRVPIGHRKSSAASTSWRASVRFCTRSSVSRPSITEAKFVRIHASSSSLAIAEGVEGSAEGFDALFRVLAAVAADALGPGQA
jgi:hypothetical protein